MPDPSAIQAAIIEHPGGPFHFAQVRRDPPGQGQVRVRIVACGVCHTDMVMRDGGLPVPFPCVLGHEGAGIVEAAGQGVASVVPGDAVLLSFASCGTCPACADHQPGYRSEEHTSELQSLMRISYAVFCLKKKNKHNDITKH